MVSKSEFTIIDTKEKLLDELKIKSEQELSKESVFRRLIKSNAKVNPEILSMVLSRIDNFSELVGKQQNFISEIADRQKNLDEKALDSFNMTKGIISDILKANSSIDKEVMIYLIDSLKEMDKYISDYTKEASSRIERLIKHGMMIGGTVGAAILAVVFNGKGS